MRRVLAIFIMAAVMMTAATGSTFAASGFRYKTARTGNGYTTKFYNGNKCIGKVKTNKKLAVKVIKSSKLTADKLEHRYNNYIVVEVIRGKCINSKGDGKTTDGFYINYKRVKGHKRGVKYTTYCVYANNNSIDDITIRADFRR